MYGVVQRFIYLQMSEATLVNFPNNKRMNELQEVKNLFIKELDGMTSQEISLVLKFVKDEVNVKLVFVI